MPRVPHRAAEELVAERQGVRRAERHVLRGDVDGRLARALAAGRKIRVQAAPGLGSLVAAGMVPAHRARVGWRWWGRRRRGSSQFGGPRLDVAAAGAGVRHGRPGRCRWACFGRGRLARAVGWHAHFHAGDGAGVLARTGFGRRGVLVLGALDGLVDPGGQGGLVLRVLDADGAGGGPAGRGRGLGSRGQCGCATGGQRGQQLQWPWQAGGRRHHLFHGVLHVSAQYPLTLPPGRAPGLYSSSRPARAGIRPRTEPP